MFFYNGYFKEQTAYIHHSELMLLSLKKKVLKDEEVVLSFTSDNHLIWIIQIYPRRSHHLSPLAARRPFKITFATFPQFPY